MFFKKKRKKSPDAGAAATPTSPGTAPPAAAAGAPDPSAATESVFLTGEAVTDRRTVKVLLDAIAGVSGSQDLERLLTDIVDRSIEVTGAERGMILMRPQGKPQEDLYVRVARTRGGESIDEDLRFSTTIANKVLEENLPLRATVHSESEALELGRSVFDLKLRAVMCVSLSGDVGTLSGGGMIERSSGVLYVDSRAATRQWSDQDLALFAALAQHIAIALENARLHIDSLEKVRLEQSLELASTIQRDLMPAVPTDLEFWDVHGWYAAAEKTAGDFYDFVKGRDGALNIVVGDVTGHGIGPALITAAAQAGLRSYLRLISDPGEVVTLLNQDLCERVEDGRFLTMFMARLDDDGSVTSLNGGHALPQVWRAATGEIEEIGRGGPALGMIPDEQFHAHDPITLDSGDVLVIYSDGLSEARHPDRPDDLFGEEGIREAVAKAAVEGEDAQGVCLRLVEAALRFSGGVHEDDVTVVVARRR